VSRTRESAGQGVRLRPASAADFPAVIRLLEDASLPTLGMPATLADFLVAEVRDRIVGAIGMERYGSSALLRSAVVESSAQRTGIGRELVERLLTRAEASGVREIYLLTTTAEHYFPRFGFGPIARTDVPASVQVSVEFREACPASAVAMRKSLSRS
jgi:N-acetylglutamate synthase-like GNAT family acetyltransferase